MHCYQWIDKISEVSLDQAIKNNHSYLIICDKEDFNENQLLKKILPEKWEKDTKKSQCYAENHTEYISGHFENLTNLNQTHIEIQFILSKIYCLLIINSLTFDHYHELLNISSSPFDFFTKLLEKTHEKDYDLISKIEERLDDLEDCALDNKLDTFGRSYSEIRFQIRHSYRHYLQLEDFCDKLLENHINIFNKGTLFALTRFFEQSKRLCEYLRELREYSMQINEVYESQINLRENHTMKILTSVTILFTPAMLIVGWYGMNFDNMPELDWYFGYLFVILLSLIITIITFIILKNKKFF